MMRVGVARIPPRTMKSRAAFIFASVAGDVIAVRDARHKLGVRPVYKRVDTCAAEFATNTAYMYSTYED